MVWKHPELFWNMLWMLVLSWIHSMLWTQSKSVLADRACCGNTPTHAVNARLVLSWIHSMLWTQCKICSCIYSMVWKYPLPNKIENKLQFVLHFYQCIYASSLHVFSLHFVSLSVCRINSLSLRTDVFWEKFRKCIFPPKMIDYRNQWYHQKVLVESFPMNGHVSIFQQS
jgi:hypothetical protein